MTVAGAISMRRSPQNLDIMKQQSPKKVVTAIPSLCLNANVNSNRLKTPLLLAEATVENTVLDIKNPLIWHNFLNNFLAVDPTYIDHTFFLRYSKSSLRILLKNCRLVVLLTNLYPKTQNKIAIRVREILMTCRK